MAKRKIKLLSTVALNEDLPGRKLKRGEVGTVVEVLGPDVYEVEFCDEDGQTYAELALRSDSTHTTPQSRRIVENRCVIAPVVWSEQPDIFQRDSERHEACRYRLNS